MQFQTIFTTVDADVLFFCISALKASQGRLWIGTANGVVLSIPCEKTPEDGRQKRAQSLTTPLVVSDSESDKLAVSTFIPTCNSTAAQLSFHGHRDAVKFFVCTKNLILSGGDGYVDFRVDEEDPSVNALSRGDRSHLIVWEVMNGQQSVLPSTSS
jgi:mitogen-activated protein kinase 8 interacting protein 3